MRNSMIQAIEDDLKIFRFAEETECEYNQRLIYSAGASWAKTLVYGHSHADSKLNDNFVHTDIMYIESLLSKVLEAYLQCFDINMDWIESGTNSGLEVYARDLASQIIKEVIYTYNLAQILSRRITPVPTLLYKYADDLYLVRGSVLSEKNVYSVGVSQWKRDEKVKEYLIDTKIVDVKGINYYRVMVEEFDWKKSELDGEYLIFKLGSKGGYSKCWKPISLNEIPQGISIIRLANEINGGFVMIKKIKDNYRINVLDPWYIEEKEIYRILYSLNYENGTPAEFKIKKKEEYYVLRCSGALPKYEDRILRCCSWPYMTYNDRYSRIVPKFLWEIVEKQISDLGINLVY